MTIVVDLETASHALTSLLVMMKVVEPTVVGAIRTLTSPTELKEKDALISEIIHGTAEMNLTLSSVMLDGYVIQTRENASLESQVKAMLLTLLALFSVVLHHQHLKDSNATLLTFHAKNVLRVNLDVLIEVLLVLIAKIQKICSNVTKPIQKHQNVINAQVISKLDAKKEMLHATLVLHQLTKWHVTKHQ